MQEPIIEVSLDTEFDLVTAYKKAMQLSEVAGLNFTNQTKFATAVSEISRNALGHVGKGDIRFYISREGEHFFVEAVINDPGPGIKDLESLLKRLDTQQNLQQLGIINCKKLSDKFEMLSSETEGTCVRINRRLPAKHPPINELVLSGWREYFSRLAPVSPYDELKCQNRLIIKTLEELKVKKSQVQEQLKEIQLLNLELEQNYEKIKQLSGDYARQNELLIKRNEELDEFAHIVSHDLKSPINNLKCLVQLMEAGHMESQEEVVSIFNNQLQKMDALIQNVLAYSRAGHEKVAKTRVNVSEFLAELIATLPRPQNFVIEVEDKLPLYYTEEVFLYQVFSNLLSNAVKYNDKTEGKIRIGVGEAKAGEPFFFVEDNGPGVPSESREVVFKMFSVLQHIKREDSTGLGLAIVKKIVNEKGGRIWIEDPHHWIGGTRFCFTWPAEVVK